MPTVDYAVVSPELTRPTAAENLKFLLERVNTVDVQPTNAQDVERAALRILGLWANPTAEQRRAAVFLFGTPNAALTAFTTNSFLRGGPLAFVHFSRELIALQLLARVIDPRLILQGSHPLCGVVAFMQGVASKNPHGYVRYVTGLAINGNAQLSIKPAGGDSIHVHVRSGSNILRKHAHHDSIPEADYVALASLRDSSNILPYRSPFTNRVFEGMSLPSDYRSWMANAGFTNVEDHTHGMNPFWARGPGADARVHANLQKAQQRAAGQVVLLSMTRGGRLAEQALGRSASSTLMEDIFMGHTVLLRGVHFGPRAGNHPGSVALNIVTWGRESNPAVRTQIPWDEIMSAYRGFVSGSP